jgi:hypothetical protein
MILIYRYILILCERERKHSGLNYVSAKGRENLRGIWKKFLKREKSGEGVRVV